MSASFVCSCAMRYGLRRASATLRQSTAERFYNKRHPVSRASLWRRVPANPQPQRMRWVRTTSGPVFSSLHFSCLSASSPFLIDGPHCLLSPPKFFSSLFYKSIIDSISSYNNPACRNSCISWISRCPPGRRNSSGFGGCHYTQL